MPAPIEVHCPECQATLKLKNRDAAGRKVPCPKCKQPFVITIPDEDEVLDGDDNCPATSNPGQEDDDSDEEDEKIPEKESAPQEKSEETGGALRFVRKRQPHVWVI